MAKQTLRETPIASIPADETILLEGLMQSMNLYTTNRNRFTYKYVLTDKGVWTKSKKMLFIKSREGFLAYADIDCFKTAKYVRLDCMIFFPKSGKRPANRIFFDDHAAALEVLSKHIRLVTKQKSE